MLPQHQQLLAEVMVLALAGAGQTGRRICHDVTAWKHGAVWSQVRVIEGKSEPIHESSVVVRENGGQEPLFSDGVIGTLDAQRDALAAWVAANRREVAA